MRQGATEDEILGVINRVERVGFGTHPVRGTEKTIIGCIGGDKRVLNELQLSSMPGVEQVIPVSKMYKLASREFHPDDSLIRVGSIIFGGGEIPIIAGPCAVEGRELFLEAAAVAKDAGATLLRGGAYKPRSSPYTFQGMAEEGLKILADAREQLGLPVCTEVMDPNTAEMVAEYADMLQIGARNAQNFDLLKAVGRIKRPVLLKRGFGCTVEEWLQSAEYIMAGGNSQVILCERGIRTFEISTRFTLDISSVPVVKQLTHLPVIIDPSHAAGKRQLVTPLARAAVAVGADGLEVEMHPRPEESVSDAAQALSPEMFAQMVHECSAIAEAMGRHIPRPAVAYAAAAD